MHARNSSQAHYLNIPGPGRNPLKASSALIRHSIECPLSTISSCRRNPSHKLNTQYFMFRTFFFGGVVFKYFMLKAKVSLTKNKNKETYN